LKLGLPRILNLYYRYLPLMAGFFRALPGVELVISPPTNKGIVGRGIASTVDDACLPLKVAFGHLHELNGQVDRIFLPRLVSLEPGSSMCPKFIGLPDMAKSCVAKDLPMITPVADVNRGRGGLLETLITAGKELGFEESVIENALSRGERAQARYRANCLSRKDPVALLEAVEKQRDYRPPKEEGDLNIRLLGRSYLLFDPHSSLGIMDKLRQLGGRLLTNEAVDHRTIERELGRYQRPPYWTLGREILGAASYFLRQPDSDGVVFVEPFQCGPASLLQTLVEAIAAEHPGVPFTALVLDEHTGDAGLMTRLEAFTDMIYRRRASKQ
jgi:predicted nucleotide-binding protein (sugar kinase/HSP70/actin superfamily)